MCALVLSCLFAFLSMLCIICNDVFLVVILVLYVRRCSLLLVCVAYCMLCRFVVAMFAISYCYCSLF